MALARGWRHIPNKMLRLQLPRRRVSTIQQLMVFRVVVAAQSRHLPFAQSGQGRIQDAVEGALDWLTDAGICGQVIA